MRHLNVQCGEAMWETIQNAIVILSVVVAIFGVGATITRWIAWHEYRSRMRSWSKHDRRR